MVSPEVFKSHIDECPHWFYPCVDWDVITSELEETVTLSNSRKVKYYEVPICFDIEVTSFEQDGIKYANMYAWGLSIQGYVILGRTWQEFEEVYEKLLEIFSPTEDKRIIIYVQNLSYEFQFICRRFEWNTTFCIKERKPLKCVTVDFVEFRCSYMLSGFSAAVIGKNLQRYKIRKMEGDLDYSKMRHSSTPLTETEWKYLINDVQLIVAYIQETAENDGGFHKIPLTKTGYVREYCRDVCFNAKNYRKMIHNMTITYDEYLQLKRAFAGGFTHANWHYSGNTMYDVDSFDFTSSYPAVMVAEKFPMSSSRYIENPDENLEYYLDKYCCLFDIEIEELDGWDSPEHILSYSKCRQVKNADVNNGRIITADSLITTVTEVDFKQLRKFYKWKRFRVYNFRIYDKMYLPTSFVKAILSLYGDKTTLKGVQGKEVEYLKSKGMINACFGMAVTDIVRDEDIFENDEWVSIKAIGEDAVSTYNKSKKRFLFYPWGVWVTAYARANLYSGILEFGEDYIYSDTDSIKGRNGDKHSRYIENYNEEIISKLEKACEYHRLSPELIRPKTIKGIEKPLGVWDYEGRYSRFKTLGAKRYMTEEDGEISITVAGLNKKQAVPYIKELAEKLNKTPFQVFSNELYIPADNTGKNTHSYIDYEFSTYLTDYLGNTELVHEYSAVHLSPAEYSLSLEEGYLKLLSGRKIEPV